MLYPDFRMRYYVLGADEINSSQDNKISTYALMDKIGFDRQRYRLGHTIIFFRAGALAGLEGTASICFQTENTTNSNLDFVCDLILCY